MNKDYRIQINAETGSARVQAYERVDGMSNAHRWQTIIHYGTEKEAQEWLDRQIELERKDKVLREAWKTVREEKI